MKLDNKGFTVIELILSFILVMFLALSMFALVNNYRNREQKESIRRDLLTFQNTLTGDIYQDTIERKVDYIRSCDIDGVIKGCINIQFKDGTYKDLKIITEEKTATEDGTTFTYFSSYILYGNVKYELPDPKFARIVDDYMFFSTVEEDSLEYGVIYKIRIRIEHQDLDDEFVIEVVTTGVNR